MKCYQEHKELLKFHVNCNINQLQLSSIWFRGSLGAFRMFCKSLPYRSRQNLALRIYPNMVPSSTRSRAWCELLKYQNIMIILAVQSARAHTPGSCLWLVSPHPEHWLLTGAWLMLIQICLQDGVLGSQAVVTFTRCI